MPAIKLAVPSRVRESLEVDSDRFEVTWFDAAEDAIGAAHDAEVLWTPALHRAERGWERLFQSAERLRWAHSGAAGVEHIPLAMFKEREVLLTNGAGVHAQPMAEHVVMFMLAASRGLPALFREQLAGRYSRSFGGARELAGAAVLILGFGGIGRAVAAKAGALGARVTGVRNRPEGEAGVVGPHAWRPLLAESDFVVLTVPLTPATRRIIGADELAAMREDAWLINVGRGGLVDEPALIEALRSRGIGGAGLDVFSQEPLPVDSPLWALENVIITPHVSADSDRGMERSAGLFKDNLDRFAEGRPLLNLVDLEAGY
jgi:phosphoglycerate dehydrogenase-like enzyme